MSEINNQAPPSHTDVFNAMRGRGHNAEAPAATGEEVIPAAAAESTETKTEPAAKINYDELSEEDLVAILEKRTGNKFKSLDDLKPAPKELSKEEKEELEAKEKEEGLQWALSTNKITKDLYDKAIVEKAKDKRDIAFSIFAEEQRLDDPKITPEEITQRFSDYYAEEEPETSWRRKKAIAEMNRVADGHLQQFGAIDTITEDYRTSRTQEQQQNSYYKEISNITKAIPAELAFKVPYTSVDGTEMVLDCPVVVPEKILSSLKKEFQTPDFFAALGDAKPEVLEAELKYHVHARMLQEHIIPAIAKKLAVDVEQNVMAKLKNIPATGNSPMAAAVVQTSAPSAPPSHADVWKKR